MSAGKFLRNMILLLLFLSGTKTAAAQEAFARNSVFVEFGGVSGFYSVNYDRRFGSEPSGFGGRLTLGRLAFKNSEVLTFYSGATYLIGSNGKYLELGGGPIIGYSKTTGDQHSFLADPSTDTEIIVFLNLQAGYRYQPVNGGFNFRAGISPVGFQGIMKPWPYISFGFGF